jgi:hypothetical protein
MAFPTTPSNGQVYTNSLGTSYQYVMADNKWVLLTQEIQGAQGYTGAQGPNGINYGMTGAINMTVSYGFESAPTGIIGYMKMPFDFKIDDFTLVASETGTLKLSVSKSNYSSHPTYTNMHGETGQPKLTGQIKNFESSLIGKWSSPTGVANDIVKITIDSNNSVRSFLISLGYSRT